MLADEKGATCAGFFRPATAFASCGIDRIERLMTDNAFAYRFSLHAVIAELGAKQVFIRPHCPWQNGKVERFNRTLQTEWAYRRPFTSNAERAAALAPGSSATTLNASKPQSDLDRVRLVPCG